MMHKILRSVFFADALHSPYKFEAPWIAWEFAHHILRVQANLVIISMAWLTREDAKTYSQRPDEPDMDTLSYWLSRLEPVIRAEAQGEIIIVLANRCGVEDEAVYAGTSAVLGLNAGEVKVYGILGRGEKDLLVVDTSKRAHSKLISEPNSAASTVDTVASQNTAATSPDVEEFPVAYDDDIYSPVSPVDTYSNAPFFSKSHSEQLFESALNSHISANSKSSPASLSPTSSSPHPELCEPDTFGPPMQSKEQEGAMLENVLATTDQQDKEIEMTDSRNAKCDKPTDQKHIGTSPELATPEERAPTPSIAPSTPPHIDQSESSFTKNDLGPRSQHTSPRPKSTIW